MSSAVSNPKPQDVKPQESKPQDPKPQELKPQDPTPQDPKLETSLPKDDEDDDGKKLAVEMARVVEQGLERIDPLLKMITEV